VPQCERVGVCKTVSSSPHYPRVKSGAREVHGSHLAHTDNGAFLIYTRMLGETGFKLYSLGSAS